MNKSEKYGFFESSNQLIDDEYNYLILIDEAIIGNN